MGGLADGQVDRRADSQRSVAGAAHLIEQQPVPSPSVTALIVSYNVRDVILDCLRAYFATWAEDAGAVVVDNASTDGSADAVQKEFPGLRVLRLKENVGFGRANNAGLALTASQFVLLMNPDVMVKPGCVQSLTEFMAENPRVGAAGPKLERPDGRLDLAARRSFPSPVSAFYRFVGLSRLFPNSPRFNRYNLGAVSMETAHEIDSGTAACLMVRRSAIDQVGFFDPDFFMYGEDIDLCYRLKQGGWRIFFVPEAVAIHLKGTSTRQETRRMLYEFHRAMWIFWRKHEGRTQPGVVNGAVWLGIWARWTLLRLRAWVTRSSVVSP